MPERRSGIRKPDFSVKPGVPNMFGAVARKRIQ